MFILVGPPGSGKSHFRKQVPEPTGYRHGLGPDWERAYADFRLRLFCEESWGFGRKDESGA
jgi:hypothetical protein